MKILKGIILLVSIFFVSSFSFADYNNLKEAVTSATSIKTYSLATKETVTENLGYLGGTQLTIFGNEYDINGNEKAGITLGENQTLNIEGMKEIKNFISENHGGFIYNYGGNNLNIGNNIRFFLNNVTTTNFYNSSFGGALYNYESQTNIGDNVVFSSNSVVSQNTGSGADTYGGALGNENYSKSNIGKNSRFEYNHVEGGDYGYGGAIYNGGHSTMTILSNALFDSNYAVSNNISHGGAIYNKGYLTINDNAKFINNTITSTNGNDCDACGGAIFNVENSFLVIGENSNFYLNSAFNSINDGADGGAIYNKGYLEIKNGVIFSSNSAKHGGALSNIEYATTTIKNNVRFIENTAEYNGGAIDINVGKLTIGNNAYFYLNKTTATTYSSGGAIYNQIATVEIGDNAQFIENSAGKLEDISGSSGGAICNHGILRIGANVNFSSNIATADGGAITNCENSIAMLGSNSIFVNNISGIYGGAICNSGIMKILQKSIFSNNKATGKTYSKGGAILNGELLTISDGALFENNLANYAGGAIYNHGILNLIANTNNVEFTGNIANGISNAIHDYALVDNNEVIGGVINLWASQNADILFNDRITSENNLSTLNINSSTTTLTANGKVVLNEDMSGYTGAVNLYGGEIELQSKTSGNNTNTNKFFSGNINLSSGTLNIKNNAIDNVTVNNLVATSNANLQFDTDLSNNTSDNFTITNNASGELNLTAINILGVNGDSGQITLFNNTKSPTLNILTTANYGGDKYTFTNSDITGVLNYQKKGKQTLKETINDTIPAVRSYSLSKNETVTENLGNLGGEQLTIFGNGYSIDGNSKAGIDIAGTENHKLTVNGVDSISNFSSQEGGFINCNYDNNFLSEDVYQSTITIGAGTKFTSNKATEGSGGVIYMTAKGENLTFLVVGDNVEFTNNESKNAMKGGYDEASGGAIDACGNIQIGNNVKFNNNHTAYSGGALSLGGTIEIGNNVVFDNNYTTEDYGEGGAISVDGNLTIGKNATFSNNHAEGGEGGAIEDSKLSEISIGSDANFINNSAESGGAIHLYSYYSYSYDYDYPRGSLTIDSNVNFTSNTAMFGGAINSESSTIIIGDNANFSYNKVVGTQEKSAQGGAIDTNGDNITIGNNVMFYKNEATLGGGGAIDSGSDITIGENANFIENNAKSSGAIYNDGNLIIGKNALFRSNSSNNYGGAIDNKIGTITFQDGVKFLNNTTNGEGGAIYNSNVLNLIANTNNVEFTGNKASGVSNAIHDNGGIINLWASDSASIIFNDRITGDNTSILNINKSSGTLPTNGKIVLNEDMSGYTGDVNLYGGEIDLQAKKSGNTNTNKFFSGNINLSSGTLNILNNSIDNITISTLTTTSNTNLKFDTDLSNNTSDNFTVTNSASGELNLTAINILGINENSGQITLFNNSKSPTLNILTTANYGEDEYIFTNADIAGVLNYQKTGVQQTFKEVVNATEPAIRSYSLSENETVTENLGYLGGTQLTIFGNGHDIVANNVEGITVYYENQTLNIEGINNITGFKKNDHSGGAIMNHGIVNIGEGINFVSNSSISDDIDSGSRGGAIYNYNPNATLNIANNVSFTSNTASIQGGAIHNYFGTVNIGDNVTFTSNTSNRGGGAVMNQSANSYFTIGNNAKFNNNSISQVNGGGAILNLGYFNIGSSAIFSGNKETAAEINDGVLAGGGAIHNYAGVTDSGSKQYNSYLTIGKYSLFENNQSNNLGGAILNSITNNNGNINCELTIEDNVIFSSNTAKSGGAVANLEGNVVIGNNAMFSSNTATENGGAIYNGGNMNIGSNSKFEHNKSDVIGGAIYNDYATLTIENGVTFSSNTAAFGGAIFNDNNSKITVGNYAIFNSNMAISYGGVIYNDSYSEMTINNNVTFSFNKANDDGGAIYNDTYSTMIIGNNATFNFNTADEGGAIYNYDYATLTIGDGVTFSSNTAVHGGAIYNENSLIAIGDNSQFISNISKKDDSYLFDEAVGGAIYNFNGSTVTIGNGTNFTSNSADEGGAICNEGYIEIGTNVSFSSNIANTGGAIANYDSSIINIGKDAQFNFNISSVSGGAIYNFNSSKILIGKNAIFNSNKAKNGGAINLYYNSTVTIDELAKFSKNIANHKGGAIQNDADSTLIVLDGAIFEYNVAQSSGGAIYNGDNSFCNLIAKTNNIEFTGNTANGISNAIHDDCGTINLWASDSASVIFNDRITSENSSSVLNINKSSGTLPTTGKIVLNENMGGYTGQVNFYNGTIKLGEKGTLFGGNMMVDNATIDMANETIQQHNFNTLTINNNLNLIVDANLKNEIMDTITAKNNSQIKGTINVKAINILTDIDEDETTEILFTESNILKNKITSVKTASSKLYKYNVSYNDGYFNFTNGGGINPVIAESAIASSVGGFTTQTNVLNQAFLSIDNVIQNKKQIRYRSSNLRNSNLYASTANHIFGNENKIENGLWIRPYALQETIKFNEIDVDNTAIGTLAGIDLAVGENWLTSFYLGYAGSNQKYEDIKVNQTGYIVGATGMFIKDSWYAGLTANINFNKAESQSDYGTDSFDMNMYSVGAKAGYNYDINDKWTLEPNLTLMYGNVSNQEYETTQGAKVDSQSNSNIIVEPQVKAKLSLDNGWQPYGLLGYVANISDKAKVVVDGVDFEMDKIDGYVEYGVGVNKEFIDTPWSCYLEATGRSGGRNGFAGNLGVKYKFGNTKSYIKPVKKEAVKENVIKKKSSFLDEQEEPEEEIEKEKEPKIVEVKEEETKQENKIEEETNQENKVAEEKQEQKIQEDVMIEKSADIENKEYKQEKAVEEKANEITKQEPKQENKENEPKKESKTEETEEVKQESQEQQSVKQEDFYYYNDYEDDIDNWF